LSPRVCTLATGPEQWLAAAIAVARDLQGEIAELQRDLGRLNGDLEQLLDRLQARTKPTKQR
jgi:hypothetical protein